MMDLRHLRYFLAVAEELHFGRAAARLHIAQPPLSRQIRDLEEEVGVRLFDRDRTHVALTPAGRALLEEARHALASVDAAVVSARRAARGETGRLRVGYVPSAISTRLPETVRAFRARYPGVDVQLREMPPATQVERLLADRLEVGFARGPIHEPALARETVLEEPLVAALPLGHRLARSKRLSVAALADERFIVPVRARGPGVHDQVLALCREAGFSPRVVQEGTQLDMLAFVASGAGVALVPASNRRLRRAGIAYRPLHERPVTRLEMTWRKDATSPVLHRFLEEARRTGAAAEP
jgi:DNA-binding transcriptional LysR family regulator